ncbi:zinc metalloprotease HtpX [Methylophaga sp. OBS4]|uniref:zinc metalloprotease HtpX n=1 Tax=Methylophaga sp. OBS4 TaxID=2991935 RepID=UPI002253AA0B|nr:zinc metalloprotease HtpX [Methylophaga sp. OBS4]MCX4187460.1 zinc metalloprotease HtpX [Methylophaga sp. OBS4]
MAIKQNIDSNVWLQHAWRNRVQSLMLLAVMEGFLALLGWLLWGPPGILILLMVGIMGTLFNQSISPWMVIRMYDAIPIRPHQAPMLDEVVSQLAERAELPQRPDLYYVPSRMLNAFAVGSPRESVIAVTDGLLRQLTLREVAGVLAHELSHIRNNDLQVMGLADLFSRTTRLLSLVGQALLLLNLPLIVFAEQTINWFAIALLIFAPTISAMAQLALSRTREFDADLNAVRLTGDPDGLASALAKIEQIQGGWLERIFMPGRRIPDPSLLRTHPENDERIARLMALKPHLADFDRSLLEELPLNTTPLFDKPAVRRHPRWHSNGSWH